MNIPQQHLQLQQSRAEIGHQPDRSPLRPGVPPFCDGLLPMLAARDFLFNTTENPLPRLPGWLNRGGVQTYESALWLATRGALSRAREDFGLGRAGLAPPLRAAVARGETLLLAYSDELLPRSREWPANSKR